MIYCQLKRGEKLEQVIYADILFLIDISMDFLSLYLTATFLKVRFRAISCIAAAVIGALFSVISVITKSEHIFLSVAVSLVMCLIAYFGSGIKTVIQTLIVFYVVNLMLGGAMTVIFEAFNRLADKGTIFFYYGNVSALKENLPPMIFMIGLAVLLIISKAVIRIYTKRPKGQIVKAKITACGTTCDFVLAEDSGNLLTEPISNQPVIFLKESAVEKFGNAELTAAMKMKDAVYKGGFKGKCRIIVYRTVSGRDMSICFRPDRIRVGKKECAAWIAIGKNLGTDGTDGIIPTVLV